MSPRCRLYLITPPEVPDIAAFTRELEQALDGGDASTETMQHYHRASAQVRAAQKAAGRN